MLYMFIILAALVSRSSVEGDWGCGLVAQLHCPVAAGFDHLSTRILLCGACAEAERCGLR